jgi:hypothetical protein
VKPAAGYRGSLAYSSPEAVQTTGTVAPVKLAVGGYALVVRIPRSYRLPHRVIFKGRNRFWARSSGGRYEPNVDELRTLFTLAPQLAERMREFRLDRIMRVVAGDAPVRLSSDCCLVLHVVPFSSFNLEPAFLLETAVSNWLRFRTIWSDTGGKRMNFDGLLTLPNTQKPGDKASGYVQVFRTGAVEAVWSSIERETGYITIQLIDWGIVSYSRIYAKALRECGADPPFAVMASFVGVKGKGLTTERRSFQGGYEGEYADRDQLHFAEAIFEDVPSGNQECATMLRSALDQLANAAGLATAPTFDVNGKYQSAV